MAPAAAALAAVQPPLADGVDASLLHRPGVVEYLRGTYRRQQRLAAQVAELRGTITRETVATRWSALFGDEFFVNIVGVHVQGTHIGKPIGDAWMANLRDTRRLRDLDVSFTEVGDAGAVHLAGLAHLQVLNLAGTKVTDAGLAHLAGLTEL